MKIIKSLLGVMAVVVLSGSMTVFAQSSSNTTTGTVEILEGGEFTIWFCTSAKFKVSGADPVVTSATSVTTQGNVGICIIDTQAHRNSFTAAISATDFMATTPGINATIPVENLYLNRVIRPRDADPIISTAAAGMIYSVGSSSEIPAITTISGNTVPWTSMTYDLSEPRVIVRGDAGAGISNPDTVTPVRPAAYLDLVVPAGQRPATYKTQITLTVIPENP